VTFVVGAYAALGGLTWVFHLARGRPKTVTVIATALMMVPLGALAAAIHLAFFNRLYLRLGAVRPPPARAPR
jgi:hypothetical protein